MPSKPTRPVVRAGARSSRQSREPERREELMDIALRLFHEKGYEATSVQDIAEEMDILKGSLYHYIRSKEDLLFWLIERTHERFLNNMAAVQSLEAGPREKLDALVVGHVRIATSHVVEARLYGEDFKSLDAERKEVVLSQRRRYSTYAQKLIEEVLGEAATDASPRIAGIAVMSMLTSIPRWFRPGGSISADELARRYSDYALRLVTS